MRVLAAIVTCVWIAGVLPQAAQAAQLAQVDAEAARVLKTPQAEAEVVGTISKGEYITVSNYPYEGYYKVRLKSGEIGFMDTNDVFVVRDPEIIRQVLQKNKNAPRVRKDEPEVELPAAPDREGRLGRKGPIHVNLHGGLTLMDWPEFATATGVTGYTGAWDFGGEAHFPISQKFTFGLRLDVLAKGFTIKDGAGTVTHNLSSGAIPVMMGFGWRITPPEDGTKFRLFAAVMGGVAFNTLFTSQDVQIASDNLTTYNALGIAGLAKLELDMMLSRSFGAFVEVGYRFLRTPGSVTASPASAAGNTYLQSGGSTIPLILNYSGIQIGLGISVYF